MNKIDDMYEQKRLQNGEAALKEGDCVDFWMVGVNPDARGHNIANNLLAGCLQLATSAGFKLAVMECTGAFSQAMGAKFGFTEEAVLLYSEYKDESGQLRFQTVPQPHKRLVFFEKKLSGHFTS